MAHNAYLETKRRFQQRENAALLEREAAESLARKKLRYDTSDECQRLLIKQAFDDTYKSSYYYVQDKFFNLKKHEGVIGVPYQAVCNIANKDTFLANTIDELVEEYRLNLCFESEASYNACLNACINPLWIVALARAKTLIWRVERDGYERAMKRYTEAFSNAAAI